MRQTAHVNCVHVTAGSRLHFGLLAFGGEGRQFGGVGAMISQPGLRLRVSSAETFSTVGPLAERVEEFARRWAGFNSLGRLPNCQVEVLDAPEQHVGLGTGTQLGLSVAAGLNALAGLPDLSPTELAVSVGRGLRSAVGIYGFAHGGLIVEQGKLSSERISPLDCRVDLPSDWRFLLVRPRGEQGLAGDSERRMFGQLPAVPREATERLVDELRQRLIPAAVLADFTQFSRGLYEFGRAAGLCYAEYQGGPYNGPRLTRLVEKLRELGVEGVGQSSWGPTIFAVLPCEDHARDVANKLLQSPEGDTLDCRLAAPLNRGAAVEVRVRGERGS